MRSTTIEQRMKLLPLALPIFFDLMLKTMFNSVDIFMISHYSKRAVTGVGTSSQIIFFMMMLFFVVGQGSGIAISQNLGAKNFRRAEKTAVLALVTNMMFGLLISFVFILFGKNIIGLFNLDRDVANFAVIFISIVMGASVFFAGSVVIGSVLRNYGYTRAVMIINICTNVLNIAGNILVIYGLFGFPVLGVPGVACSTVISQFIGFIANLLYLSKKFQLMKIFREIVRAKMSELRSILKDILVIGGPSAGEYMSYSLCQLVITWVVVNYMGTEYQTARIIVNTVIGYLILTTSSIANASSILVGYNIGAGKQNKAYRLAKKNLFIAIGISFSIAVTLSFFRASIIGIFVPDTWIITTASALLVFNIIQEPGRCFNLVIGNSLRGAGDVAFILILGICGQWTILLGGSVFFGVYLKLGLIGVWIAMSLDEWSRGLIMLKRWRSKKWVSKSLIKRQVPTLGQAESNAELSIEAVSETILQ
jgi:putative MATE family efflux protein